MVGFVWFFWKRSSDAKSWLEEESREQLVPARRGSALREGAFVSSYDFKGAVVVPYLVGSMTTRRRPGRQGGRAWVFICLPIAMREVGQDSVYGQLVWRVGFWCSVATMAGRQAMEAVSLQDFFDKKRASNSNDMTTFLPSLSLRRCLF